MRGGGIAFAQNQRNEVRYVNGDGQIAGCVAATRRSDCKNETLVCQDTNYLSDGHVPAVTVSRDTDKDASVLCVASNATNAEICEDISPNLLARQYKDPPYIVSPTAREDVICVADDNANSAIDVDLAGTLKIGGGGDVRSYASNGQDVVGTLCARDSKGVGSQYVADGKVIVQIDAGGGTETMLSNGKDYVGTLCAKDGAGLHGMSFAQGKVLFQRKIDGG